MTENYIKIQKRLIKAVETKKELYDVNHPNYMKPYKKNVIWTKIAADINLKNGNEAKNMWMKLRNAYRDALRRQRNCLKSGTAPENVTPWRFQKEMSFLARHTTSRSCTLDIRNEDSDEESRYKFENAMSPVLHPSDQDEEQTNTDKDIKSIDEPIDIECQIVKMDSEESNHRTEYQSTIPVDKINKNKKVNAAALLKRSMRQHEKRALLRAEEREKIRLNSVPDDALYNFFLAMYQSTKNMLPIYQHNIKNKLFNAVSDAEAEIFKDAQT